MIMKRTLLFLFLTTIPWSASSAAGSEPKSSTLYLEVTHRGSADMIAPSEGTLLEDLLLETYNCGQKYRFFDSAQILWDTLEEDADGLYLSWVVEVSATSEEKDSSKHKCSLQGFFQEAQDGEDDKRSLSILDIIQDEKSFSSPSPLSSETRVDTSTRQTPRGSSPSSRRRLKSSDKEDDSCSKYCSTLQDFALSYNRALQPHLLVELTSILSVEEVVLLDALPCRDRSESFSTFTSVLVTGDPSQLTEDDKQHLQDAFARTYMGLSATVCDPHFRQVGSTTISSVVLVEEEDSSDTRWLRRLSHNDGTNSTLDSNEEEDDNDDDGGFDFTVLYQLVFKTTGVCNGCVSDQQTGLFNELTTRKHRELEVQSRQSSFISRRNIQESQDMCYCDSSIHMQEYRAPSPGEFKVALDTFVKNEQLSSVQSVEGVEDNVCLDSITNLSCDLDACKVPFSLQSPPASVSVQQTQTRSGMMGPVQEDSNACSIHRMNEANSRFYSLTVSIDTTLTLDTCSESTVPKFMRLYHGSGADTCIDTSCRALSTQGHCGKDFGTKMEVSLLANQEYTIELFDTVGDCYTAPDASEADIPFLVPGKTGLYPRAIGSGGCPSGPSTAQGKGSFYRFSAVENFATLCNSVEGNDRFFVFQGSCSEPRCIGSGRCNQVESIFFETTKGKTYWVYYDLGDAFV